MGRLILFLLMCFMGMSAMCQRITANFRETKMSDALLEIERQSKDCQIHFIYDELQDFTVTVSISNRPVSEALRLVAGFYPIRITNQDKVYIVECVQKEAKKVVGRILDEKNHSLPLVNVVLLSHIDSTYINGGVSNNNGDVVIPCNRNDVLAKISFIGYKTMYKHCVNGELGTIRMHEDAIALKQVTVKGDRPQYKMVTGGMDINVENTILSKMSSTYDVLSQLPRVSVNGKDITVFGKGSPIVYINNKQVRNPNELLELKPDDIKSITVLTNPGAEYNALVESVIRIYTKKRLDKGFSLNASAYGAYNEFFSDYELLSTSYQTKKFEVANSFYIYGVNTGEYNHLHTNIFPKNNHISDDEYIKSEQKERILSETFSTDYSLNDSNSLGASYRYYETLSNSVIGNGLQEITRNNISKGTIEMNTKFDPHVYMHQADLYYVGKVRIVNIDFNSTYCYTNTSREDFTYEKSHDLGNQEVHSNSLQHSSMFASKLTLKMPVWKGMFLVGSEYSHTNSYGNYYNREHLVDDAEFNIYENNIAGFVQYDRSLRNWAFNIGLRYENIVRNYYSFGTKDDDVSRRYSHFFPNMNVTWNKGNWYWQLSLSEKTNLPSYRQLRSTKQYDNRYLYEGGNPELQPSITYGVESNLMYRWINLAIGYKYVKDVIEWTKYVNAEKEYTYTSNYNFNREDVVYASLSLSPKFGIFHPNWNLNYKQLFFDARKYGSNIPDSKPLFSFSLNNYFKISETTGVSINYNGSTAYTDAFIMRKASHTVNLEFAKSFAKRTWVIYLNANDIFKTGRERWTMYGIGSESTKNCYNYTRSISLQVTYNFNAKRSKYKGTGAGNEERKRL